MRSIQIQIDSKVSSGVSILNTWIMNEAIAIELRNALTEVLERRAEKSGETIVVTERRKD